VWPGVVAGFSSYNPRSRPKRKPTKQQTEYERNVSILDSFRRVMCELDDVSILAPQSVHIGDVVHVVVLSANIRCFEFELRAVAGNGREFDAPGIRQAGQE
jgi:hypothetical protein